MKNLFTSFACILIGCADSSTQTTKKLSPLAAELFKNVKSAASINEKNLIAKKTEFILSGNKDLPFAQDKDSKDFPFGAIVLPTDMNKDGKEEIFISFGNTFTSGHTGSSIILFIKNASGVYEMNLGFPGTIPDVLTTANKGYPDLVVGGPGFEYPVFRWNGKIYDNYKTITDDEYAEMKKTSADELSKEYQKAIK